MRGPHLQSHVTHKPRGHVTNQKRYISTFTRPMDPKLNQLVTQDEGTPTTKSCDTSTWWSRDKQKTLYFPKLSKVVTQDEGTSQSKTLYSTFTWPMDHKLSRVVFQMRGSNPQCHVTLRCRSHLTNKKCQCIDPKLSRVVTQDEENSPTKPRDTSIVSSHDKSKIFCFHFHMVQGPQTQQYGDQNEKTPPNMSYATSTTPSRDNYLVGSVHLFYYQLKLSPKNRQISNDYGNNENVQLVYRKF